MENAKVISVEEAQQITSNWLVNSTTIRARTTTGCETRRVPLGIDEIVNTAREVAPNNYQASAASFAQEPQQSTGASIGLIFKPLPSGADPALFYGDAANIESVTAEYVVLPPAPELRETCLVEKGNEWARVVGRVPMSSFKPGENGQTVKVLSFDPKTRELCWVVEKMKFFSIEGQTQAYHKWIAQNACGRCPENLMFALDVEFTADVYFKTTLQAASS